MSKRAHILALAAAGAMLVGCQNDTMNSGSRASRDTSMRDDESAAMAQSGVNTNMPATDRTFIMNAASGDMFEVHSSQLAVERSQDPALKKFAQQMITDHTKTTNELKSLCQEKGWTMPTQMTSEHRQQLETLRNARGDAFDAAYRASQLHAHSMAISLFNDASNNASDRDLKMWANKTLPALKMHSDMMKNMSTGGDHHMGDHHNTNR